MDGESREGKMIEDLLEKILVQGCSVFFSAEICSLNGINDKMSFHSLFIFRIFRVYIILYIFCIYLDFTSRYIVRSIYRSSLYID